MSAGPSRPTLGFLLAAVLLLLVSSASAFIHADQAGLNDWHKTLVGTPRFAFYTRPARKGQLIVGTERNVLASLNTKTGDIVWRQVLEPFDELKALKLDGPALTSISGTTALHTRQWDAPSGSLVWDYEHPVAMHSLSAAADIARVNEDVIALVNGNTITRLAGEDGSVSWTVTSDSGATYERLYVFEDAIYAIGAREASSALEICVLKVDLKDGKIVSEYQPPNGHVHSLTGVYLYGDQTTANVLWNGVDRAYRHALGQTAETDELDELFGLKDPRIHSVLDYQETSLIVVGSENKYSVRTIKSSLHTFSGEQASSVFSSASVSGQVYISCVRSGETEADIELVSLSHNDSPQSVFTASLPLDRNVSGEIVKTALDVIPTPGDKSQASGGPPPVFRVFAVTADGSTRLFKSGEVIWSREESLTAATTAEYVDLPEKSMLSQEHDELDELPEETASHSGMERYLRRLRTHLAKSAHYPQHLLKTIQSFTDSKTDSKARSDLFADFFGVRKLVVFASKTGKVVALDTENGQTVWERYFPKSHFEQIETVRAALVRFPPILTLISRNKHSVDVKRINALTGSDISAESFHDIRKVIKLPVEETEDRTHVLALVGNDQKLYFSPSTPSALEAFATIAPQFHLYLTEGIGASEIEGFSVESSNAGNQSFSLKSTWKLTFPVGETIAALGTPSPGDEKVASLGRVLGNRSVLYKYLNPNLLALATIKTTGGVPGAPDFTSTVFVYLLDTVTGTVHYRSEHEGAGDVWPGVPSVFVEQRDNWAVLSYWNHGPEAVPQPELPASTGAENNADGGEALPSRKKLVRKKKRKAGSVGGAAAGEQSLTPIATPDAKGYEIVALEFYESSKPDQRTDSETFSSFHSKRPHVLSQTYAFAKRISAIGATVTRAGITTREILLGLADGHLYGVSKRLLDPRRPIAAPTADEKEEMLYPYRPALDFNPKAVASYDLHVAGIQHVRAVPTKMESTSLVVAFGLDVFCGRRSPSKTFDLLSESFNYMALLATIAACVMGIWFSKRLSERKKVKDLWR
ncbi:hypothetical protein HDU87_004571 [Geranomyces variabilis]|uniref:ER membrane protein complex subunit 1 n=1 Tax=Geranomyces variabilis TaxID=109894 RepID=A0AAD5XRV5_9FUNG|nr:hypothetical protein HDU87_004571 [Geranomyces variabilis]